jgi:glyoxylase-like metal-dependent hydrolase (beta-lactamase superfamily II)
LTDEEAAMASDRDDRRAAATALASLQRLADLGPALVLPAHGPLPAHPDAALQAAFRRAKRLVDDPDGAVWYGARRVFAYALMIYDGIPAETSTSTCAPAPGSPTPPSCSASPKTTWPANSSAP